MPGEQLNLEWVIKVVNDAKAGIDSAIADYKRLGGATTGAGKAGETIGGSQQQQRMSGLHTRITQLTGAFRKFGIELETIDLYFISGFKVLGLFKLLDFAKQSVLSFENYRKSLLGVQLAAELSGQTMNDAMTSLNNLLKMGKLGAEDLAEAMRNLLKKGYSATDAERIIKILTMSGTVFGTQANMPLGEAVKRSTEGLLQEISRLVDATRLTKNLDQMWKDYARTINKAVDELDEHEKRQAVVNYFLQESIGLTEKYEQANTGLTGALGEFAITFDKLKRQTGAGLSIPVTWSVKGATSLLEGFMADFDMLAAAIKANNLMISIPIEFGLATGWGFIKDLWNSGKILSQNFEPQRLVSAFISAFDSAKGKLHELSYAVDDFYSTTFGRDSAIYKLIGMGKIDVELNPVISRETFQAFNGIDIFNQHLSGQMWWNKKEDTSNEYNFGAKIDAAKLEQARKMGEKIAQAFSYPLERGFSDVFFNLFTGQKKSFTEMARNFGLAIGRAISDALAEALMMPVKKVMTSMFTSMAGSMFGGSLGGLFSTKSVAAAPASPEGSITVHSPITVNANDTNSFAKTLKQTSKLAAGLMVKEMRKSRNMEKQFRRK